MPSLTPGSTAPGPERPLAHYASVAHVSRVYDYLLGGKDYFAVDREAAEQAMRINPDIVSTARANRAFLGRTTSFLAGEAEGLDLLQPGLVRVPEWRPASVGDAAVRAQMWDAIGRKP